MKSVLFVCVVICLTDIAAVLGSRPASRHRRDRFTDYLMHMGRRGITYGRQAASFMLNKADTDDEDLTESVGSGQGPDNTDNPGDILDYFKEVPRSHWSCCMLGRLAGDKGFHCHAQLYKSALQSRNRSRGNYRKTNLYGRYYASRYGKELMYTFQKCLASRANEFNKCCYAATVERREMHRWHMYHEYKVSIRGY
ncbi:uncharacterized protein LOC135481988 [Liolophura sinensis]|uniref:uncharacterized protein LOC135481988 n=1 Tax=Liolophura sinensis TaxID=3198878 RepID=UPI0031590335